LAGLLTGVTDEKLHEASDMGPPIGCKTIPKLATSKQAIALPSWSARRLITAAPA
jgi:hypothetical protein